MALSAILSAVHQGLDGPLEQGLEVEAALFTQVAGTRDAREGTQAFMEKRPPSFEGR